MTALTLRAANDLTLVLDDASHWRLAWCEADWLGPIGFAAHCDGQWYRSAGVVPGDPADPLDGPAALDARLAPTSGADDLGTFRGVDVGWGEAPLPVRTLVRAYADVPLIVFRIEAARTIGDGGGPAVATGTFAQPSVVCPWLDGATVFGDVDKYATVGDKRVANITRAGDALTFDVLGAPGSLVAVCGCADHTPHSVAAWVPGTTRTLLRAAGPSEEGWTWDPGTGLWTVRVTVPPIGRMRVAVRLS